MGGLFKNAGIEGYVAGVATRRLAHVTVAACASYWCGSLKLPVTGDIRVFCVHSRLAVNGILRDLLKNEDL
jgi:hypothetical protein